MTKALLHAVLMGVPLLCAAAAPDERIARVEHGLLPPVITEATKPMRLADRMRHYGVPGLSVAVVDDGRFVWARAWGVAQQGRAEHLTPATLMQAASISKPLAALGAFKLADQGRLDLDADVNTQLKTWRLPAGAQSPDKPVTVRGLIGHTAGLTVSGFRGYAPGVPVPTLAQILDGVAPANSEPVRVAKPPGNEWRYSGGGYVLLQQLMDDVTGEPFASWMQREVMAPAGMASSLFGALPDAPLARAAVGHQNGRVIEGRRATHPEQAAAALWTTPSDLARLSIALQRALAGEASPWLQPARLAEALRPVLPNRPHSGLGFGLERDGAIFGHDGSNFGFEARWRATRDRAVIVMANANGAMALIDEVMLAVAAAHGWTDALPPRICLRELQAVYAATPLFLRGSMNAWGLASPLKAGAAGRFTAEVELPVGPVAFKFASEDWQRVDLGATVDGRGPMLAIRGGNLQFDAKRAGHYRFTLDLRDAAAPRYTVQALQ